MKTYKILFFALMLSTQNAFCANADKDKKEQVDQKQQNEKPKYSFLGNKDYYKEQVRKLEEEISSKYLSMDLMEGSSGGGGGEKETLRSEMDDLKRSLQNNKYYLKVIEACEKDADPNAAYLKWLKKSIYMKYFKTVESYEKQTFDPCEDTAQYDFARYEIKPFLDALEELAKEKK